MAIHFSPKSAQKWGTEEVVVWLETEGLAALSSIAREKALMGPSSLLSMACEWNQLLLSRTAMTSGSQLVQFNSNLRASW